MRLGVAAAVVVAASLVLLISTGIRSGMGLLVLPMSQGLGLSIGLIAFAIAAHQLLWGLVQPLSGAIGDRWGATRVVCGGAFLMAAGLGVTANATGPAGVLLGLGLLFGLGLACTGFGIVSAATARVASPERRSTLLGVVAAAGALGQAFVSPAVAPFAAWYGWSGALIMLAVLALATIPIALPLGGGRRVLPDAAVPALPAAALGPVLRGALRHPGFVLLNLGFFVCGFQLIFVVTHLPSYLVVCGLPALVGAQAIGLIGLFNAGGCWLAGFLGGRLPKRYVLSGLFGVRTVAIAAFLAFPVTETSALLFAMAIGSVWLGSAPLTGGLIAQIFGVRHMGALYGVVFMSHQVGAFLGSWLGGLTFDLTGGYGLIWGVMLGLGALATFVYLPIREGPVGEPEAVRGGA